MIKIKEAFNKLLEEVFPDNLTCACCNEELTNDQPLCQNCLKELPFIKSKCKKCGQPINDFSSFCKDCKGVERNFTMAVSPFIYDGTAKHLVYKLKYGGAKYVAKVLAKYLAESYKAELFKNIDLVTCVPLSKERLKSRGYNQAQELAEEMCAILEQDNINLVQNYNLIKRIKNTPTQTKLTKLERSQNLKDAFEFVGNEDEIKGKNILIIDDIFTTGATLEEITSLLKKHNVGKVYCLTCCHTPKTFKKREK